MESHQQIEDQAAAFLARRDSGEWTPVNQAALERWLASSTARRVGFLRLEAVWDEARRLKALSAGLPPGAVPPRGEWRHTPFFNPEYPAPPPAENVLRPVSTHALPETRWVGRRSRLTPLALAATVLLALGAGAYYISAPKGDRYSTPIGGIASVPLSDGSNITLNTATKVRVELSAHERDIRLDAGEAFFEVAHDATRPFVVQVANKRVIAVGTRFSVRRAGDNIRVIVTEGRVRIESASRRGQALGAGVKAGGEAGAAPEVTRDDLPGVVFLTPGSIASASDDGIVIEHEALSEVEDDLTWREGYLTFHDTSLADAVAEFNRYNTHRIVIADPTVAAIRISGTFRALNYEAFVRVLDDGFAIHSRSTEEATTLNR